MPVTKIITPVFRASFVKLFEPGTNSRGQEKYGLVAIFEPDADFTEMKEQVRIAAIENWGSEDKIPKFFKSPFRLGQEKTSSYMQGFELDKHPYYRDKVIVSFNCEGYPPDVVYADMTPCKNPRDVYSGMYARASVRAFAFPNPKKPKIDPATKLPIAMDPGVSFGLNNVQKIRDGEPLGAMRSKAEDDFEAFIEPTTRGNHSDLLNLGI
jgi:hypothetical protein